MFKSHRLWILINKENVFSKRDRVENIGQNRKTLNDIKDGKKSTTFTNNSIIFVNSFLWNYLSKFKYEIIFNFCRHF